MKSTGLMEMGHYLSTDDEVTSIYKETFNL